MAKSVHHAGLALVLAASLAGAATAGEADLSRAAIEERAEAAARYLVAVEAADGRFHYEFDFLRSRFLTADNIVRQAGAGYAVNQFFYLSGKPDFAEPAARTIGYYEVQSVPHGEGALLSEDRTLEGGRAGGTALALLAELFHSRATGADYRPDLRLKWLKGLAAQQLSTGGIAQRPGDAEEDSYSTGETWLALAHYADLDPDEPALAPVLERLEARAMTKYLATPDNMFAHWGLMAAAERLKTTGDARYGEFIAAFAADYVRNRMPVDSDGAGTCAALEGITAAAAALETLGKTELADELRAKIEAELPRNLAMQLRGDNTRREFGPGQFYEDPKLKTFTGAFLNSAYALRTRIDATQHCLSALLLYRALTTGDTLWKT